MKNFYLLLLILIGDTYAKAQTASQYYFKAQTGVALEDMTSGTSLIEQGADATVSGQVNLPFSFSFAGKSYNSFSVSEDGIVVLGSATYSPYPYDNYFTQTD